MVHPNWPHAGPRPQSGMIDNQGYLESSVEASARNPEQQRCPAQRGAARNPPRLYSQKGAVAMPQVLMNFQHFDDWVVHFIEANCYARQSKSKTLSLGSLQELATRF